MDNIFVSRLRELRGATSQAEFAEKIGTKQTTYSSWERGLKEPGIQILVSISRQFGVSTDWLLGLTDDRGGVSPSDAADLISQIHSLESRVRSLESSSSFGRCG